MSPSTIRDKFRSDLAGVAKNDAVGIAFVTNQEITLGQRGELDELAHPVKVHLFHLEKVASILDTPEMLQVRLQFLDISFTDSLGIEELAERLVAVYRESAESAEQTLAELRDELRNPRNDEVLHAVPMHLAEAIRLAEDDGVRLDAVKALLAAGNDLPDISTTILRWLAAPPTWLIYSGDAVWGVLAEAIAVYGTPAQTTLVITRALRESSVRYGYWRGRLLLHALDVEGAATARLSGAEYPPEENPHPLEHIAESLIADEPDRALRLADSWVPDINRDRDLRTLIVARCHIDLDEPDRAIQALTERIKASESAGLRVVLAQQLMRRAHLGRSDSREADLTRALHLATEARDRRRSWRMPSVDAVAAAADACSLQHDWPAAWRLVRPAPHGVATAAEAADRAIRAKAALIAAAMGEAESALRLAAHVSPFELALIQATLAESRDLAAPGAPSNVRVSNSGEHTEASLATDNEHVVDTEHLTGTEHVAGDAGTRSAGLHWRRAWALAADEEEHIFAARGLAAAGIRDVDGLRDLLNGNPEFAAEFDRLTELAPHPGELPHATRGRLRGLRRTNLYAAMRLAELLSADGQPHEAGEILTEAADVFGDQHLRLMAASVLQHADQVGAAAQRAREALAHAGSAWSGKRRAWEILHDAAVDASDWNAAASQARNMLGDDPADDTARWCLIAALHQLGRFEEAWQTIGIGPGVLEAKNLRNTLLLLELTARFGDQAVLFSRAAKLVTAHLDDERLAAHALTLAYIPISRAYTRRERVGELDDETVLATGAAAEALVALHAATEAFVKRYPESDHFRQVRINPEQPMASIEAMAKRGHHERSKLLAHVIAVGAPTGMLASVTGRSYAEVVLRTGSGCIPLRSPIPHEQSQELDALREALTSRDGTVVDASALNTVSLLREIPSLGSDAAGLAPKLFGALYLPLVTDTTLRDLLRARESMSLMSTVWVDFDDENDRMVVCELDKTNMERLSRRSVTMLQTAQALPSVPARYERGNDRDRIPDSEAWLGLVEFCSMTGRILWSDDLGLRRLARSEGVTTLGTSSLLEHLLATDVIGTAGYTGVLIQLVANHAVDLPIDLERLRLVAASEHWEASAAAMVLGRKWSWASAALDCMRLLADGLSHNAGNLVQLQRWSQQAATGIAAIDAGDQLDRQNLSILLAGILRATALSPACVAAAVSGARTGAPEIFPDAWTSALRNVHRELLKSTSDWQAASIHLAQITSSLPTESRMVVVNTIFRIHP